MEHVKSHSELEIVKGCISLMQMLMGYFEEYLDLMGIIPDSEEERFSARFSYFEIIQRLLLWKTYHSAGTSTMQKCAELGLRSDDYVVFADERQAEVEDLTPLAEKLGV